MMTSSCGTCSKNSSATVPCPLSEHHTKLRRFTPTFSLKQDRLWIDRSFPKKNFLTVKKIKLIFTFDQQTFVLTSECILKLHRSAQRWSPYIVVKRKRNQFKIIPDDSRIVERMNQGGTRFRLHASSGALPGLQRRLARRDDTAVALHILHLASGRVAGDYDVGWDVAHLRCQCHCRCMVATSCPVEYEWHSDPNSKVQKLQIRIFWNSEVLVKKVEQIQVQILIRISRA